MNEVVIFYEWLIENLSGRNNFKSRKPRQAPVVFRIKSSMSAIPIPEMNCIISIVKLVTAETAIVFLKLFMPAN